MPTSAKLVERNSPARALEPHELRKLVLKLKWMGMDNDARQVTHILAADASVANFRSDELH
jgi:hypothetical protein